MGDSEITHTLYAELVQMAENISYIGWDYKRVLKILIDAAKSKNITAEQFQKDMFLICAIVLSRGTNTTEMVKRMSPAGKQAVTRLITTYGITKEKTSFVRIQSIAQVFPHYSACLLAKKVVSPPAGVVIPNLPVYYHFSGAPAIMTNMHKQDWLQWNVEFSKKITKGHDGRGKVGRTMLDDAAHWWSVVAESSSPISEDKKLELKNRLDALENEAGVV